MKPTTDPASVFVTDASAPKEPEKPTPESIRRAIKMKWTPIFWASALALFIMVIGGFAGIASESRTFFLPSLIGICLSPVAIYFGAVASGKLAELDHH